MADHITAGETPALKQLYKKILADRLVEKVQLFFKSEVLTPYKSSDDFKVIRTDTSGRISKPRIWAVDFGISDNDQLIHASLEYLVNKLPATEFDHWVDHLVTPPVSSNYLKGAIRPGCFDDGDIREWE